MRIDGLSLHEVALYARGGLGSVAAARAIDYDCTTEGPALAFLRACDAYEASFTSTDLKALGTVALMAKDAKPTRAAVMRAVTLVTHAVTGKYVEPFYEELVDALGRVKCISGGELVQALNWHKKTGSTKALSSIAMSLSFWLRRAGRTDLAAETLLTLMGVEVIEREKVAA